MIDLEAKANWVRRQILEMTIRAGHGHIGGSLSCVEIMAALYYKILRPQDKFILSKGHAVSALYPILADLGYFPIEELKTFCQKGSRLWGHPNIEVPGIEVSTGSLGNGLGIGAGMALAAKMNDEDCNVYVLMSDGECYEGSTWEAAMFAGNKRLDNLVAIVDWNNLMVMGKTGILSFQDKWRAFGWLTALRDGHEAHPNYCTVSDMPMVYLAQTIKGKGISFMENNPEWHGRVPHGKEIELARAELGY